MKHFILALAGLIVLSIPARAGIIVSGTLTGDQEVPPNLITPAIGTFSGMLNQSGSTFTLNFTLTYFDLIGGDIVGANFHNAPLADLGPDVRDYDPALFTSPDGTFSGTWTSSDAQPLTVTLVNELVRGNIYFDIQTQQFPTGEIRGQLAAAAPEPSTLLLAVFGQVGLALAGLVRGRLRLV